MFPQLSEEMVCAAVSDGGDDSVITDRLLQLVPAPPPEEDEEDLVLSPEARVLFGEGPLYEDGAAAAVTSTLGSALPPPLPAPSPPAPLAAASTSSPAAAAAVPVAASTSMLGAVMGAAQRQYRHAKSAEWMRVVRDLEPLLEHEVHLRGVPGFGVHVWLTDEQVRLPPFVLRPTAPSQIPPTAAHQPRHTLVHAATAPGNHGPPHPCAGEGDTARWPQGAPHLHLVPARPGGNHGGHADDV